MTAGEEAAQAQPSAQTMVAGVRFTKVGKLYHFDYSASPELEAGDYVIVETARGRQMGQIMGFTPAQGKREYRQILRPATARDLVLRQQWEEKQPEALETARAKSKKYREAADAKFVAAQYNYDGSAITFLYTSENRVDTTRLQSALQRDFSAKVDMRQVGPRDVAKLIGGYGACGIERCCSTFLTDFSPVSIKMAKIQGISLNPAEITGMCGRLRCCLVYEYEQYVQARKQLPRRGKKVGTPQGEAVVVDVHPLQDAVTVYFDGEGRTLIQREELIPLDELRALEKAAKSPCTKHGDGDCDCGKPPGQRRADQTPPDDNDA
jgi:cell fate regulator YaaT (PSP1 superfamily)